MTDDVDVFGTHCMMCGDPLTDSEWNNMATLCEFCENYEDEADDDPVDENIPKMEELTGFADDSDVIGEINVAVDNSDVVDTVITIDNTGGTDDE